MNVNHIKEKYPVGTRIHLDHMEGEPHMSGLNGTVSFVDDIGQIHVDWENGSTLALNPEYDHFNIIKEEGLINVIFVEPGKEARVIGIKDELKTLQNLVGGYIEEYMPFEDDVAIICNEDGKTNGLKLNREIATDEGELLDIIAGNFLLAYAPIESEKFLSLPKELEEKYLDKFRYPEFFRIERDGIIVGKIKQINHIEDPER